MVTCYRGYTYTKIRPIRDVRVPRSTSSKVVSVRFQKLFSSTTPASRLLYSRQASGCPTVFSGSCVVIRTWASPALIMTVMRCGIQERKWGSQVWFLGDSGSEHYQSSGNFIPTVFRNPYEDRTLLCIDQIIPICSRIGDEVFPFTQLPPPHAIIRFRWGRRPGDGLKRYLDVS